MRVGRVGRGARRLGVGLVTYRSLALEAAGGIHGCRPVFTVQLALGFESVVRPADAQRCAALLGSYYRLRMSPTNALAGARAAQERTGMAASVPAKPNKAGGRDERFDVVRVRSSSVDACAALQEQTANCKTRFSLEMRAARRRRRTLLRPAASLRTRSRGIATPSPL